VDRKYVELDDPIRIVITGDEAFISYPRTKEDVVVVTGGTLLKYKDANTLASWRAAISADGSASKDHRMPELDWVRIGK